MIAVEQIGVTGELLTNFEQFLQRAGPDDVWMLSEVLHQWQNHTCYTEDDYRNRENAIGPELIPGDSGQI